MVSWFIVWLSVRLAVWLSVSLVVLLSVSLVFWLFSLPCALHLGVLCLEPCALCLEPCALCPLPVYIRYNQIERSSDRYQVGYLKTFRDQVESAQVNEIG